MGASGPLRGPDRATPGSAVATVGRKTADFPCVSLAREVDQKWEPVDKRATAAAASLRCPAPCAREVGTGNGAVLNLLTYSGNGGNGAVLNLLTYLLAFRSICQMKI